MYRWIRRLFSSPSQPAQAHLTFGATSVGRSLSRTRALLRKQLWIWPIIATLLLSVVGYALRSAIERTMVRNVQSQLETLLHVEQSMLESWLRVQETNAGAMANSQSVRALILQMLEGSTSSPIPDEVAQSAAPAPKLVENYPQLVTALARELGPAMSAHEFISFFVADRQRVVAASNQEVQGTPIPAAFEPFIVKAMEGQSVVSPPFPSISSLKDEYGHVKTGVPTMFVLVPVRDASFQIVAVLGMRIRPEREFTRILLLGRLGESGETYAVDRQGNLLSNSRFDDELILLGLLPDVENSHSLLNLSARDPGGNMHEGFRPKVRRAELSLTKAAAEVTQGHSGIDVHGYRNYRGVPVVGAWTWLPRYEMGIITEFNQDEAYQPLTILQGAFYSIFGLLTLSSIAIFAFTLVLARANRKAQEAVIEAKHLGQYRLEERIGSGAMGIVYKGHHAMLRRPTAIKLLHADKVNEVSIQRFEREVQLTCQLNHPNTVSIYDYGRTPEGVFYYAMEYLDGINLQQLVEFYGPQNEARVVHILKQICGSLYEAHALGLVHRDIKPANIMLNRRGGEPDVVKVLDFGLVRAIDDAKRAQQSSAMVGTPLYMSPEAIQTPELIDGRSDLYAVGAVGYFLITGHPVFDATSLVELCQQHVDCVPITPSARRGSSVSPAFENALLACLEKNRAKRPQTARDLASMLERIPADNSWSLDESESWWGRHDRTKNLPTTPGAATTGGAASETRRETSPQRAESKASIDQTIAHSDP